MKLITNLRFGYGFLRLSNTSYNSFIQNQRPQSFSQVSSNESIQALAQTIANLRRKQLKYLDWRYKQEAIKNGKSLFEVSLNRESADDSLDSRSYFVQQAYKQQQWGEPNSLTNFAFKGASKGAEGDQSAQEVKKKDIYDVELSAVAAADKIKIIKVIRETLNLGLKEAKELVEKTPVVLKQAKKQQADELAAKLTAAGCNITVK